LNNLVEKLRKDRGLNQEELSKALKVSRQTISAIENGKYNPSLDLAFTISDFFDYRLRKSSFLIKEVKEMKKNNLSIGLIYVAFGVVCLWFALSTENSIGSLLFGFSGAGLVGD